MEQLSFKYLHIKEGKTGMLDFFFNDYLKYAAQEKENGRDAEFIDWVETVYEPADVKARFMAQWSGNPITELLRRE